MRAISFAILLAVLQAVPSVKLDTIGPKVGETVPDFELRDQHGASRTLSSLAGPNGTMLVFYRSADW
jgi:hypothetical protein